MNPLVTLDEMKTYLGIPLVDTTQDVFLTEQLLVITEAIQNYCGRIFEQASYTQTFYQDDQETPVEHLTLFHYPVSVLTSIETDLGEDLSADVRLHGPTGVITSPKISPFFSRYDQKQIIVEYTAGFATIPAVIESVCKSLVEERYNKKISGIGLNFGRDVQQISIPGTINVSFDYTLQANDRKTAFGMILGDYTNVLDFYRSERPIVGEIGTNYVS